MDEQNPDLPEGVKMLLRNDPEEAWKKLGPSLKDSNSKGKVIPLRQTWLRIAAGIALLIGVGSIIYLLNGTEGADVHTIANNTLEVKSLVLPDSSVVYLHPQSEVVYSDSYSESRDLVMKGEAFFEVQRDPSHPFKITIGQSIVQVLGTSFNISDDTTRLDVTVATGKVSVQTPVQNVVYLEKGEKASYNKTEQKVSKIVNDDPNYDSWKTKTLRFRDTPLPQVLASLGKYFNVKFEFDSNKASGISYTSNFVDPTLNEVLVEMQDVLGITYRQSGKNVIITIP